MMDINWLDDFLAAAELGGFSRAAEERGLSQPAFSRRIRALEEWVGVDLLDRSTHRIDLTEAGAAFKPAVEDALRTLRLGRLHAREAAEEQSFAVRVACTHMLASTVFPGWLADLESRLPHPLSVQLSVDNMLACERMMRRGDAHLLLCHHHDKAPAELEAQAFRTIKLGADTLVPVSAPGEDGRPRHPLPERPDAKTNYLAYREESGLGRILGKSGVLEELGGVLDPVFRSHAAQTLATLAVGGRGLTWAPTSLITSQINTGQLLVVGDESYRVGVDICLIRPAKRQNRSVESVWNAGR